VPSRQEDIAPDDRLQNTVNKTTTQLNNRMDKTDALIQELIKLNSK
jgi:hypothetical protein